jgi:branched-chain amino acid transport system substrate-binding protein
MGRPPLISPRMTLDRHARTIVLVAFAGAWICACDRDAPIKIGVVLDKDGLRGATLAMEAINAQGGINGHPLTLLNIGGSRSTKARLALETAERLAADRTVLAVVGHANSSASLAASQVYNARHVVQIAPTSSAPLYSRAGPYSFRLVASDVYQGVFLADQVLGRHPRPRVAVLFVNDDYGRPLHGILGERLRAGGLTPVLESPYAENDGAADFSEMIEAVARSKPDVLIWIGRAYDYVRVRAFLAKALPTLEVLASDGFSGGTVANDTLHQLDGVSYVRVLDIQRPDAALRRLQARYQREHWGAPSDQAVLSYDAVWLLAEAVRHAGPRREAIRDWLSRVGHELPPVQGLSGPIAFAQGGDRKPQYFLEQLGKARLDSVRLAHR